MALTDESNMVMPVAPMGYGYGMNNGGGFFGGDWAWILLLLLIGGNGWGFGGGFGGGMWPMMGMMGGMDGFGLYPWLNNSQNINSGFRDQMLQTSISSIGDKITSGFGDVQLGIAGVNQGISNAAAGIQQSLCSGFAGTTAAITGAQNAIAQQMYSNEIANLNRSFAEQTANAQGFTGVQAQMAANGAQAQMSSADLKYTVATEACADRAALAEGIRDVMENCNRNNQAVLDKLCALELDGVKSQLAQAQRENVALQNAVNMAAMRESQTAQTASILAGQTAEVDALYNRLKNCPVNTVPVYGNQPIFTCPNNGYNCGCGVA